MKKILLLTLVLTCILSYGQKKKIVTKKPTFKITYDKFEKTYIYNGETGNIGIYATGSTNDFFDIKDKYLTLNVYDSYLTYAKGIIFLFSDGTKMNINTNEELGKSEGKGIWRYFVMTSLTDEQWLELSNKTIVSYKFHIFERNYKNGNQFKSLVNYFYE